jgi:Fe-S cluster biogenesis protein NfuA
MTGQDPGAPPDVRRPDLDVEALLAVLEEFPDPRVREAALDLLEAVLGLHRSGLTRILELIGSHREGEEILRRLRDDAVVGSLLASHGLADGAGTDVEARVLQALEKVRPYMHGHGGDVELVEVAEGRVSLRLAGACHGCGFSENTLRLGIEQILRKEVPEIGEIVVTGSFESHSPAPAKQGS